MVSQQSNIKIRDKHRYLESALIHKGLHISAAAPCSNSFLFRPPINLKQTLTEKPYAIFLHLQASARSKCALYHESCFTSNFPRPFMVVSLLQAEARGRRKIQKLFHRGNLIADTLTHVIEDF